MERNETPKVQRSRWNREARDQQYRKDHNIQTEEEYQNIIKLGLEAAANGFGSVLEYLADCYKNSLEKKSSKRVLKSTSDKEDFIVEGANSMDYAANHFEPMIRWPRRKK